MTEDEIWEKALSLPENEDGTPSDEFFELIESLGIGPVKEDEEPEKETKVSKDKIIERIIEQRK